MQDCNRVVLSLSAPKRAPEYHAVNHPLCMFDLGSTAGLASII
jgi:hypothetical protein